MSDFDIVISLNPSQPVAGAAKVTEAVAKIETQSKETQKALDAVSLNTKQALDAQAASAERATAKFKQGAAAASAAWGLLDQKLKLTDTAAGQVVNSAVKFGTIGAQVAGPWGAAIGAIGGGLLELGEHIDNVAKHAERLIDAANAPGVYRARQAWLESALAIERVGAQLAALDGLRRGQALAAAVPGMLAVNEYNAELKRQHDLLDKITGSQRDYHAQVDSLNTMLKNGTINSTQFNNAIAELNKGLESNAPKQYVDKLKEARELFAAFVADQKRASAESRRIDARGGGYTEANQAFDLATSMAADDLEAQRQQQILEQSPSNLDAELANLEAANETTLRLAANTRKWNEELVQTNITAQVVSDVLNKAASSFADTLVDAANGADVSWREWGANMLVMIEKIIAQALVLKAIGSSTGGIGGGGTGLLGLLFGGAHATGGSYTAPATGGGADSIPVMFRMSPRETATFTPHGQAFGGSGASGPGTLNLTVAPQIHDERAIQSAMASPGGQRVIYNVVRQALGAIRPLG